MQKDKITFSPGFHKSIIDGNFHVNVTMPRQVFMFDLNHSPIWNSNARNVLTRYTNILFILSLKGSDDLVGGHNGKAAEKSLS
jgi:hypothetical protein